jgi:hypothetical protein
MKKDLTVFFVDKRTPELSSIVIRSFEKFCTNNFSINYLIVENSDFDVYDRIKNLSKNIRVINKPNSKENSHAHGEGLEAGKLLIETDYVFTCHSDTCVTSASFFEEIEACIDEDVFLAGVCEDAHPDRIKALHCSGLLSKTSIFKSVSLLPKLPTVDTADELTVYCKEMGLKTKKFRNTYNDRELTNICNSPFKELGKDCGVDRCLDSKGNVMFIHQGRGTTKYSNVYSNSGKMMTESWIKFCNKIL